MNVGQKLEQALLADGLCKAQDLASARHIIKQQPEQESMVSLLVRLGMVSERAMAETLAQVAELKLAKPADYARGFANPEKISSRFLKDQMVVPLNAADGTVDLVMADPTQDYAAKAIAMALELPVRPCIGIGKEIQAAIDTLYSRNSQDEKHPDFRPGGEVPDVEHLRDMASEAPVIRMVNQIIQRAVDARASDIHIEPFEALLKIRCRVDGVLRDENSPPLQMAPAIISRVKIMAGLDIAERRLPQDGRINIRVQGQNFDIRVSTIPTMFGESVVMRILHRESVALDFDSLGFSEPQKVLLHRNLSMPHGMIIVTGPTGSGKTTTLYTALNSINSIERKVITVEDPIEYNIEGINQIQVNPAIGLNFAGCLRSIVRQDPDVIMVGEMRDLETARICIQSALTGHLVISTLHTNDAAGSITRLLEMGVEDYLLTSTLTVVIAQRLVRQLCPHCKVPYQPSESQIREFDLEKFIPGGQYSLCRSAGCEECGNSGFKGRIGIIEILPINERVRALVLEHASAGAIERAAREDGMHTMFEDGIMKSLHGITTLEEILRVTQEA